MKAINLNEKYWTIISKSQALNPFSPFIPLCRAFQHHLAPHFFLSCIHPKILDLLHPFFFF